MVQRKETPGIYSHIEYLHTQTNSRNPVHTSLADLGRFRADNKVYNSEVYAEVAIAVL